MSVKWRQLLSYQITPLQIQIIQVLLNFSCIDECRLQLRVDWFCWIDLGNVSLFSVYKININEDVEKRALRDVRGFQGKGCDSKDKMSSAPKKGRIFITSLSILPILSFFLHSSNISSTIFLYFIPKFYWFVWRRQWHPTPVLLPGKSHGRRILVGCSPWGHRESDTTEWLQSLHFTVIESVFIITHT